MSVYVFEGPKWPSGMITWSLAATTYASDSLYPFSEPISAAYQSVVAAAFQGWADASGLHFQQVTDGPTADIRVGFAELSFGEGGQTVLRSSSGTFQPDVLVQLEDPDALPLIANGDGTYTYDGTSAQLGQVLMHEIGHALGLAHTTDPGTLMYPVATNQNRTISTGDAAGIHALYGTPGGPNTPTLVGGEATYALPHTRVVINATQDGDLEARPSGAPVTSAAQFPGIRVLDLSDGHAFFDPTGNGARVARLFETILGRAADVGGLTSYTAQVDGGQTSLEQVAEALITSPEYVSRYGSPDTQTFIGEIYRNALGRAADPDGYRTYADDLAHGTDHAQAALGMAEGEEAKAYVAATMGDRADAESYRLFHAALGRAPDLGAEQRYASLLDDGASPNSIAQIFLSSPEFAQHYGNLTDSAFAALAFQNALGRPVDPVGGAGYVADLQSGTSRAQVLTALADSTEGRAFTASATHDSWIYTA